MLKLCEGGRTGYWARLVTSFQEKRKSLMKYGAQVRSAVKDVEAMSTVEQADEGALLEIASQYGVWCLELGEAAIAPLQRAMLSWFRMMLASAEVKTKMECLEPMQRIVGDLAEACDAFDSTKAVVTRLYEAVASKQQIERVLTAMEKYKSSLDATDGEEALKAIEASTLPSESLEKCKKIGKEILTDVFKQVTKFDMTKTSCASDECVLENSVKIMTVLAAFDVGDEVLVQHCRSLVQAVTLSNQLQALRKDIWDCNLKEHAAQELHVLSAGPLTCKLHIATYVFYPLLKFGRLDNVFMFEAGPQEVLMKNLAAVREIVNGVTWPAPVEDEKSTLRSAKWRREIQKVFSNPFAATATTLVNASQQMLASAKKEVEVAESQVVRVEKWSGGLTIVPEILGAFQDSDCISQAKVAVGQYNAVHKVSRAKLDSRVHQHVFWAPTVLPQALRELERVCGTWLDVLELKEQKDLNEYIVGVNKSLAEIYGGIAEVKLATVLADESKSTKVRKAMVDEEMQTVQKKSKTFNAKVKAFISPVILSAVDDLLVNS
eukprot:6468198-Amphidinium_carterae.2